MSSGHGLVLVKSNDLAFAWREAFAHFAEPGVSELAPLVVNISGFQGGFPSENAGIRREVDNALSGLQVSQNACLPETTANTIFPESLWQRYRAAGRQKLFEKYTELVPRLQKRDQRNGKGTYFARMINGHGGNQLEHVLSTWLGGNHRRSAQQIVIFDPAQDHSKQPFLGFPCLDYLTFTPDTSAKTLSVTALYAAQYIFDRGYGNYLGLCRLGRFMAEQMDLQFTQLTCIASLAQAGDAISKKGDLKAFAARLATHVDTANKAETLGSTGT